LNAPQSAFRIKKYHMVKWQPTAKEGRSLIKLYWDN
jgi:hypothetical protein